MRKTKQAPRHNHRSAKVLKQRAADTITKSRPTTRLMKRTYQDYIKSKKEEEQECTFRPQLNKATRSIAKSHGRTGSHDSNDSQVFAQLYEEAEIRGHKKRISQELGIKAKCSF